MKRKKILYAGIFAAVGAAGILGLTVLRRRICGWSMELDDLSDLDALDEI